MVHDEPGRGANVKYRPSAIQDRGCTDQHGHFNYLYRASAFSYGECIFQKTVLSIVNHGKKIIRKSRHQ